MKILFSTALLLFHSIAISQERGREGYGEEMEDSLHKELIGEWYLSGLYTTDVVSSKDYSTDLKNNFQLKVTEDSVFFLEPESRFYKHNNHFFYTVTFEDHYLGTELNLFNTKKHKIPFETFYFQFVGNELLLEEELNSDLYDNLTVHRSYVFNRAFDPLRLESNLQHKWFTTEITDINLSNCPDTIVFKRQEENPLNYRRRSDGYSISFQRNPGWSMIAYTSLTESSESEGVYTPGKSTVLLHPENQEIELIDSNGSFRFRVLFIDETSLVLVKIKPNK